MSDPRIHDLDRRIKACMEKHGLTERDLLLVHVRRHLLSNDIVSAAQAMPARFLYDIAYGWKVRIEP
ncbi:hypothetical protein [Brucella sp. BO2]|uniref:hypothetical protein n=1 Tax=Brucella sp. BO2 TaxID=693750 RepID=UPI00046D0E63|nr:hypothetical protein [Brucella sp. BO2]